MTSLNGRNVYTGRKNGEVVIMQSGKAVIAVGKGSKPVITGVKKDKTICVWEKEKQDPCLSSTLVRERNSVNDIHKSVTPELLRDGNFAFLIQMTWHQQPRRYYLFRWKALTVSIVP